MQSLPKSLRVFSLWRTQNIFLFKKLLHFCFWCAIIGVQQKHNRGKSLKEFNKMKQLQLKSYDEISTHWGDVLVNGTPQNWRSCGYWENLEPLENTVKSFYNKAKTVVKATTSDGNSGALDRFEVSLWSYDSVIARMIYDPDGLVYIKRECPGIALSQTTLRHIKAFCGMNKAQFSALPLGQRFPL